MEIAVGPKPSAWATSARAITAPDRMARKIVTRLRASLYVRERVASRLQCSVARICSLAAALDSRPAGATSVDIGFPSMHSEHARTGPGCATPGRLRQVVPVAGRHGTARLGARVRGIDVRCMWIIG